MQKFKAPVRSPSSTIATPERVRSHSSPMGETSALAQRGVVQPHEVQILSGSPLDLKSVCQRQLEQTIAQLPILSAWIVYRNRDDQKRQFVSHRPPNQPGFDSAILSYLESEVWLAEDLPVMRLTQLACPPPYPTKSDERGKVAKRSIGKRQNPTIFAYVYLLGKEEKTDEYLLLWTYEALSLFQQQSTQQQAQLLYNYLTVALECDRQREEIQLLEQVVRRGEHQLRNSLGLIGLYAENLYLGLPASQFQEQAMIIRETVKELGANLTNLLSCSQQAKLHVAPHELQEILTETVKVLQPRLDEKQLHLRYPTNSVTLAVDRWQMKQVFENLLSNAIDFSPVGGIVTCDWRGFRNEVLVEIGDQGAGLSQEDLKEAFTPFYSRRPGGTGIGLTIAKKIILDHQGSIWVQNLTRGGAQFSFTLPRYPSQQSESPRKS